MTVAITVEHNEARLAGTCVPRRRHQPGAPAHLRRYASRHPGDDARERDAGRDQAHQARRHDCGDSSP